MRFQDAAKDARAVVYAGIQADPLVARAAALLADATAAERVLARAVMNGEPTDADVWRTMFPTLFGDGRGCRRGRARALARRSWRRRWRSPTAASRSRSQFRGALVEELTARLLARPVPASRDQAGAAGPVRRGPAEIHPYDVTVERPGAPPRSTTASGARGASTRTSSTSSTTRGRHAAAEGEKLTVALVVFDATRSCKVRLARQTAPRAGTGLIALETLNRLAGR